MLARLFPVERAGPWGPLGLALAGLAAAAGAAAQLARQAALAPWHTLWAEDGSRFFSDAWTQPFAETILHGFHGYLHVYPRLLAGLSLLAPAEWAAVVFSVAAAATTGVLAVTIYRAASGPIEQPLLRALLAALLVLSPVTGEEVMNNLANLQWYLAVAAFWMLLWRPATSPALVWQVTGLALAALSAPVAVVLAPLAGLRVIVARRHVRELIAPVAFLTGMGAQVVSVLATASSRTPGFEPVLALQAYSQRVALVALVGNENAGGLWEAYTWAGPAVALVALAGLLGAAVTRGHPTAMPALVAASASMAFLAAAADGRAGAWASLAWEGGTAHELISRYMVVPVALCHAVVILSVAAWSSRASTGVRRVVPAVAAVLLLAGVGRDVVASNPRSQGPLWREAVASARLECETDPRLEVVEIPVAPAGRDFRARARCDDL